MQSLQPIFGLITLCALGFVIGGIVISSCREVSRQEARAGDVKQLTIIGLAFVEFIVLIVVALFFTRIQFTL